MDVPDSHRRAGAGRRIRTGALGFDLLERCQGSSGSLDGSQVRPSADSAPSGWAPSSPLDQVDGCPEGDWAESRRLDSCSPGSIRWAFRTAFDGCPELITMGIPNTGPASRTQVLRMYLMGVPSPDPMGVRNPGLRNPGPQFDSWVSRTHKPVEAGLMGVQTQRPWIQLMGVPSLKFGEAIDGCPDPNDRWASRPERSMSRPERERSMGVPTRTRRG